MGNNHFLFSGFFSDFLKPKKIAKSSIIIPSCIFRPIPARQLFVQTKEVRPLESILAMVLYRLHYLLPGIGVFPIQGALGNIVLVCNLSPGKSDSSGAPFLHKYVVLQV